MERKIEPSYVVRVGKNGRLYFLVQDYWRSGGKIWSTKRTRAVVIDTEFGRSSALREIERLSLQYAQQSIVMERKTFNAVVRYVRQEEPESVE